jgi:hypothetical protein
MICLILLHQLCLRLKTRPGLELIVTCASADDTAHYCRKSIDPEDGFAGLTGLRRLLPEFVGVSGVTCFLYRKEHSSPGTCTIVPLCACMHYVTALAPRVPGSFHSPVVSHCAASRRYIRHSACAQLAELLTADCALVYLSLCAFCCSAPW